jgi:hypothetical protein
VHSDFESDLICGKSVDTVRLVNAAMLAGYPPVGIDFSFQVALGVKICVTNSRKSGFIWLSCIPASV